MNLAFAHAEPQKPRPVYLLINTGSGTTDSDQVRTAFEAAVEGREHDTKVVDKPQALVSLAHETARRAQATNGIIAVAGGDGAINTVAQAAWKTGCAMAVVPRGTFNLFARTHSIPLGLDDALQVLTTGTAQSVQVGMVNGRIFLVNASIGLYPKLLEDREETKRKLGRNRLVALASAVTTLVRSHRRIRLQIQSAQGIDYYHALTLFIGNNAHQLELLGIPLSDALKGGELAAVLVRPAGNLSLLGLMIQAALGRLGEADIVDHFSFQSISVHKFQFGSRNIKVAIDGEISRMQNPLAIHVAPRPLTLIKPAPADN